MCSNVSLLSRGWTPTNSAPPCLTSPPAASTASSQMPFLTLAESPSRAAAKIEDLIVWACWSNSLALSSDDLRIASAWVFLTSILVFCLFSASKRSSDQMNWMMFQSWKLQTYRTLFPSLVWPFGQYLPASVALATLIVLRGIYAHAPYIPRVFLPWPCVGSWHLTDVNLNSRIWTVSCYWRGLGLRLKCVYLFFIMFSKTYLSKCMKFVSLSFEGRRFADK